MSKNTLNLHLEILDKTRQEILTCISPVLNEYVMGGGTALALQLAHRKSFDFDFFSLNIIPKNLLEIIGKTIKIDNVTIDNTDELTFFTRSVKLTFLYYPFKSHFPPITTKQGWSIYPVEEIALRKAYTIGRKGEYRDYFDLYTILKGNYLSFGDLICLTKEIYQGVFDEKLFLEQLVYFDDLLNFDIIPASSQPLPSSQEIKQYFEELVKIYLSNAL